MRKPCFASLCNIARDITFDKSKKLPSTANFHKSIVDKNLTKQTTEIPPNAPRADVYAPYGAFSFHCDKTQTSPGRHMSYFF